ncbi:hypothetical protein V2J09_017161 [Rumex salicifolius]
MAISKKLIIALFLSQLILVHAQVHQQVIRFGMESIDCGEACTTRCQLSSRPNLCKRACGTCCRRCGCVPPGTSGHQDVCPCYFNQTTHGGKPNLRCRISLLLTFSVYAQSLYRRREYHRFSGSNVFPSLSSAQFSSHYAVFSPFSVPIILFASLYNRIHHRRYFRKFQVASNIFLLSFYYASDHILLSAVTVYYLIDLANKASPIHSASLLITCCCILNQIQPGSLCSCTRRPISTSRPVWMLKKRRHTVLSAVSMADGQSDEPSKLSLDDMMDKANKYWDKFPEPVKSFPWNIVLKKFIQLILDLTVSIIMYLSAPLLAVTALSEMSYCAQERRLRLVPVPLIIGFSLAGILRNTALEINPSLKDAEAPWHLFAIATFFILLKLPGPYYPYWGRILIPHFANGGLLRTLWGTYVWYKRP